jgi:site-specific DNA recombinase
MSRPTVETANPEHTEPVEAVLYLRVSTKDQAVKGGEAEGYSIPAQREAGLRRAEQLGAIVSAEFVDAGESARSADRPELQKMLTYLTDHSVRYVIVHKVDRLARNRFDDVEINLALRKVGVILVSATENIDETPSGMLLHGIMSSIAEFYSRNLATEVVKGMGQKVKTGGTPGKPPLGYRNVRVINGEGREMRTIELDPERAELIRWAFQAYASGDWSITRMVAELELRGLTNLPTPKYPVRPVRANHLYAILTHPYYKGEVVWRGARYPGRHPKLVDEATWAQVQAVLAAHATGEKQRDHPHYLKSSVFCGDCGSRLIITNAKNRYGSIYPYFVCVGRHQKRTECTRKAVLISVVEELIEDFYVDVQIGPELRRDIEDTLFRDLAQTRVRAEAEERDLTAQQQRLIHERTKLLQAHYAGAIPLDLLKTEQDRITGQLEVVQARLTASHAEYDRIEQNLKKALDLAGDCHRMYLEANDLTRRLLNQAFFERLYIDEDGIRAALAEPFTTLLGPEVMAVVGRQGDEPAATQETARSDATHVSGGVQQATMARPDWNAAYIRHIRANRPATNSQHSKPAPRQRRRAGLKDSTLVPSAGFEPAAHGLGNRR